jgi:acetyl-CoA synthetase
MTESFQFGGEIVWRPTAEYIDQAHLTRFMRQHNIPEFPELLRRSTEDITWFTESILNYLDIQFYKPYSQLLDLSEGIAWPHWVVGGKMNIVHNCLDKYIGTPVESRLALITEDEKGNVCTYTYGELWRQVNRLANALRKLG